MIFKFAHAHAQAILLFGAPVRVLSSIHDHNKLEKFLLSLGANDAEKKTPG